MQNHGYCRKQGVFELAHINGAIEIFRRLNLVAMATKIGKLNTKLSKIRDRNMKVSPNRGL